MFRRVDAKGRTIGEYLAEDVAAPLQAAVVVGVKEAEAGNYAPVREMPLTSVLLETVKTHVGGGALDIGLPDFLAILKQMKRIAEGVQKPVFKQHLDLDMKRIGPLFNSSGLRRGETPSGNGNCSARGLAKVAAAMANRRQLS